MSNTLITPAAESAAAEPHPDGTAALALMRRYGVRASPLNFTLWYEYVQGRNSHLKAAIDALIDSNTPFTEEIGRDLHNRFLAVHRSSAPETIAQLNRTLDNLAEWVHQSSQAAAGHEASIAWVGDELERGNTDLAALIDRMRKDLLNLAGGRAAVAKRVQEASARINAMIGTMSDEIQLLSGRNSAFAAELKDALSTVRDLERNLSVATVESETDGLTGLSNRKSFDRSLERCIDQANKTGTPLSLVMTDVDHFKRFNDTYGHQVGDQVLRLVAKELSEHVKSTDLTARYGGEEFALLMPGADLETAKTIVDRLKTTLQKRTLVRRQSREAIGQITLSFGLTQLRREDNSASFLERADKALYLAKRNGRNRLEVA